MLLKSLALVLIRGYQKFISPYKGFSCALRVHAGGHSCSRFGYDAINRHGIFLGLKLLYRRTAKCSWHAYQHASAHVHLQVPARPRVAPGMVFTRSGGLSRQGGFVDADCSGCDGCDVPSCDMPSCDLPSCDVPSCEMPSCDLFHADTLANCGCDALDVAAWSCDPAPCNPSPCNTRGCGSGPGHVREQQRLDELKKRRKKKKQQDGEASDGEVDENNTEN